MWVSLDASENTHNARSSNKEHTVRTRSDGSTRKSLNPIGGTVDGRAAEICFCDRARVRRWVRPRAIVVFVAIYSWALTCMSMIFHSVRRRSCFVFEGSEAETTGVVSFIAGCVYSQACIERV